MFSNLSAWNLKPSRAVQNSCCGFIASTSFRKLQHSSCAFGHKGTGSRGASISAVFLPFNSG